MAADIFLEGESIELFTVFSVRSLSRPRSPGQSWTLLSMQRYPPDMSSVGRS